MKPTSLFTQFNVTSTDATPLPEGAKFFVLRMDEHGSPMETAAARASALRYAELNGDAVLEAQLREALDMPKAVAVSSMAELSQTMPNAHVIRFEYPQNSGNFKTITVRLLTPEEQVEIHQYDPANVMPPKWGPSTPDVAPADRQGEYDEQHPAYLKARRDMANRMNTYLLDKCWGLGLPDTVPFEDKVRWFMGEEVAGLAVNRTPNPLRIALVNAVWAMNYGRVIAEADFI